MSNGSTLPRIPCGLVMLLTAFLAAFGCKKPGGDGATTADGTETSAADDDGTDTTTSTDDADDADDDDDDDVVDGAGTTALTLGHAYPEGLTLEVLPPVVTTDAPSGLPPVAGTIALPTTLALLDDEVPEQGEPQSALQKIESAQAKLRGEGECFSPDLLNSAPPALPSCYTPDTDLDFVPPATQTPRATDTASGEACLAAYARAKAAATVALVDRATGLFLAVLCQAKKAGLAEEVPAAGASLDLKDQLVAALDGASGLAVETAKLSRLDDKDGNPVFKTEITLTHQNGQRLEEVKALHSPDAALGNSQYIGRLWIRSGMAGMGNGQTDYLSLDYQRSGTDAAPRLQTRVVQGAYVHDAGTAEDPFDVLAGTGLFDDQGRLDLSAGADFTKPANDPLFGHWADDSTGGNGLNNTMGSSQLIASDANILTGEGKLAYWQNYGGNYAESARGMIFNLSPSEDGDGLEGCVVSGATFGAAGTGDVSIRRAQHEDDFGLLVPGGYYHPGGADYFLPMGKTIDQMLAEDVANTTTLYRCDEGLCQKAPWVYRQCFAQNEAGKYVIDSSKMDGDDYQLLQATDPLVTGVAGPDYDAMPSLAL